MPTLNFSSIHDLTCQVCQKPFEAKKSWQRFCSQQCRNQFHARKDPHYTKIYVIQFPALDAYKIGVASNPLHRLTQLQVALPADIKLIMEMIVERSIAYQIESAIHNQLQQFHLKGEWFSAPLTTILDTIERVAAPHRNATTRVIG